MPKYALTVYLSRGGVSKDAGTEATCEAKDGGEARQKLLPKLKGLRRLCPPNTQISWNIIEVEDD